MKKWIMYMVLVLWFSMIVFSFTTGFSNRKTNLYENMVNASVVIHNGSDWGSGVFIEDNVIVTAAHVLDYADSFSTVELADGTILKVDDFYIDKKEDVGFIFIDADELSIAKISSLSGDIGDIVYGVGAPYCKDLKFTISKGILSHLDRDVFEWEDLLQADVVSGPGSSGGPLYNSEGDVIGICVANPCPYRSGNVTLCESAESILEAYERCMDVRRQ